MGKIRGKSLSGLDSIDSPVPTLEQHCVRFAHKVIHTDRFLLNQEVYLEKRWCRSIARMNVLKTRSTLCEPRPGYRLAWRRRPDGSKYFSHVAFKSSTRKSSLIMSWTKVLVSMRRRKWLMIMCWRRAWASIIALFTTDPVTYKADISKVWWSNWSVHWLTV